METRGRILTWRVCMGYHSWVRLRFGCAEVAWDIFGLWVLMGLGEGGEVALNWYYCHVVITMHFCFRFMLALSSWDQIVD